MGNTKFNMWLDKVNQQRKEHWDKNYSYKEYTPLTVKKGQKYMKIIGATQLKIGQFFYHQFLVQVIGIKQILSNQ